jgi:glutamine amidotransferase
LRGRIALVDYGSGNLRSAEKALARAARTSLREYEVTVTSEPGAVAEAERIVLPGVGAFGDCMAGLASIPGMIETLRESVLERGVPFLGICVGMQLLANVGHEFGDHAGLGWIAGEVAKITPSDSGLKIPHMGWNALQMTAPHALFEGIAPGVDVYFVHSFGMQPEDPADVLAVTDYGGPIVAAVGRGNIAGVQFHPEKSQAAGLKLLGNFLDWRP